MRSSETPGTTSRVTQHPGGERECPGKPCSQESPAPRAVPLGGQSCAHSPAQWEADGGHPLPAHVLGSEGPAPCPTEVPLCLQSAVTDAKQALHPACASSCHQRWPGICQGCGQQAPGDVSCFLNDCWLVPGAGEVRGSFSSRHYAWASAACLYLTPRSISGRVCARCVCVCVWRVYVCLATEGSLPGKGNPCPAPLHASAPGLMPHGGAGGGIESRQWEPAGANFPATEPTQAPSVLRNRAVL